MPDRHGEALSFLRQARSIRALPDLEARFAGAVAGYGVEDASCLLLAEPGRPVTPRLLLGSRTTARRAGSALETAFSARRAYTFEDRSGDDAFGVGLIAPVHGGSGEVYAVVLTGRAIDHSEPARPILQACSTLLAFTAGELAGSADRYAMQLTQVMN